MHAVLQVRRVLRLGPKAPEKSETVFWSHGRVSKRSRKHKSSRSAGSRRRAHAAVKDLTRGLSRWDGLRSRAQPSRDAHPAPLPGEGVRQVHDYAPHGDLDPGPYLEQPLAQRRDLRVGAGRAPRLPAKLLHQDNRPRR